MEITFRTANKLFIKLNLQHTKAKMAAHFYDPSMISVTCPSLMTVREELEAAAAVRPLTVKCPSVHNLTIADGRKKKQRVSNESQAGSKRS